MNFGALRIPDRARHEEGHDGLTEAAAENALRIGPSLPSDRLAEGTRHDRDVARQVHRHQSG